MHLSSFPARVAVPINAAHGPEQSDLHKGREERTAPRLGEVARPENLGVEKGLEEVEGVVVLGVDGSRE